MILCVYPLVCSGELRLTVCSVNVFVVNVPSIVVCSVTILNTLYHTFK